MFKLGTSELDVEDNFKIINWVVFFFKLLFIICAVGSFYGNFTTK